MYDFLSDEWMAAAREIRERYEGDLPDVVIDVRINQIITEVPFGEGVINAYIDTSNGSLDLELGELAEPDAVLMIDYATAKAMIVERDPAVVMQSFMEGRIKVQGDMMKIMAMQATAAAQHTETAERIANEIRAITN
ncbi:MAG TPA: SCP2 sterol-binding domain-containing protein [Ilumatobacter sp.]|nr:SCP2 sterol-binding domain-containing protein [Ilumatobacter sp.]